MYLFMYKVGKIYVYFGFIDAFVSLSRKNMAVPCLLWNVQKASDRMMIRCEARNSWLKPDDCL